MQDDPQAIDGLFTALADPLGRDMLDRLGRKPTSLEELATAIGASNKAVTYRVAVLDSSGLTACHRLGRRLVRRVCPTALEPAERWLGSLLGGSALAADEPAAALELDTIGRMLEALASPSRRMVIEELAQGHASAPTVARSLGWTQLATRDLRLLTASGLVEIERSKRPWVFRIAPGAVRSLAEWLAGLRRSWETAAGTQATPTEADEIARTFRPVAQPIRVGVLTLLSQGPDSLSALAASLGTGHVQVLNHVRALEGARLAKSQRKGNLRICETAPAGLERAAGFLAEFRPGAELPAGKPAPQDYDGLACVFRAVANPIRVELLRRLRRGPASIDTLAASLQMARAKVRRHVRELEVAGLVSTEEPQQHGLVRIAAEPLQVAELWLRSLIGPGA